MILVEVAVLRPLLRSEAVCLCSEPWPIISRRLRPLSPPSPPGPSDMSWLSRLIGCRRSATRGMLTHRAPVLSFSLVVLKIMSAMACASVSEVGAHLQTEKSSSFSSIVLHKAHVRPLLGILLDVFRMYSPYPVQQILVRSSPQHLSCMNQTWLPVDSKPPLHNCR